ncbi:MAG: class I SAM-dependent methyltransferase [Pseudomonadota bacterium]
MTDGWAESAEAWIARIGERGDWRREHVLDPAMLELLEGRRFARALDVGCGEGRFCRLLENTVDITIGIDPTARLIDQARAHDPAGQYFLARAEQLPFAAASFDLVVSYLSLIDIPDFRTGILEMVRVLAPGGTLLIANLTGLVTAGAPKRWVEDENGQNLYYPLDRYLEEHDYWDSWAGIRVINRHRPLSAYMTALLEAGLQLRVFDEPNPRSGDPARQARYRRVPWFMVMEWQQPLTT